MTDIEKFAKSIIEEGGEFHTLETSKRGKLVKIISHYEVKGRIYNDVIFHVYNSEGKRVFVSTSYNNALTAYEKEV